jgi:hypothetical protein
MPSVSSPRPKCHWQPARHAVDLVSQGDLVEITAISAMLTAGLLSIELCRDHCVHQLPDGDVGSLRWAIPPSLDSVTP